MAIEFVCPTCNGALEVGDELAGRVIRCGGCMTMLRVPEAGPAAPAAPESPFEAEPRPSPPPPRPRRSDSPTRDDAPPGPSRRDPDDPFEPYDDRPRRARRREAPPAPTGRGVFFWLVVVGALLLFGFAACCGGLYLLLPNAEWQEHKSDKGGFTVQLPGKAKPRIEQMADLQIDPGATSEGAMIPKRGKVFVVLYRDVKPAKDRAEPNEKVMEKAIRNIQKAVEAPRPLNSKAIKVGDFEGREVTFRGDKGWFAARVVVADSRLYVALAGGGWTRSARDADVRRFLDSFKITDEKLLKKGKGKEEKDEDEKDEDKKDESEKPEDKKRKGEKELPVAPPPRLIEP